MKMLIILNDPPYGTERSYNALRLARALLRHEPETELTLFLMGDAIGCAKKGQAPPGGYYNIELMLTSVLRNQRSALLLCGTCMAARGVTEKELIAGAQRSDMDTLARASGEADKVLVY